MKLLLLSNSTNYNSDFLSHADQSISDFLPDYTQNIVFIPYAAVSFSYTDYEKKVQKKFKSLGYELSSIHRSEKPVRAVEESGCIMVGGGNTWHLRRKLFDNKLIEPIREKIMSGTPYIGWSAGTNLACPTIMTTNDMPVIDPRGLEGFNLLPFQVNPHYTDINPPEHAGETRAVRIREFIEINRHVHVIGLREGSILKLENEVLSLLGNKNARIFKFSNDEKEVGPGEDISFLFSGE